MQYTFDPPATVEAMKLDVGTNEVAIADWVDATFNAMENPPVWNQWMMYWQFNLQINNEPTCLVVDNGDYLVFAGGTFHKMSAQLFNLFFSQSPPA